MTQSSKVYPLDKPGKEIAHENVHSDEISLIDLSLIVWRRRYLVFSFIILGLFCGIAVGLLGPGKSRDYSAVIIIGQYMDNAGYQKLVQEPTSLVEWLNKSILPDKIQTYAAKNNIDPTKLNIQARASKSGNALVLTGRGPESLAKAYEAIMSNAAQKLTTSSDDRIVRDRAHLKAQIAAKQIELAATQDSNAIELKRSTLEQSLQANRDKLANLVSQAQLIKQDQKDAQKLIAIFRKRIDSLDHYISVSQRYGTGPQSPREDVATATDVLLGTQAQQYADLLTRLTRQTTIDLPKKIASDSLNLSKNSQMQLQTKGDIQRASLQLQEFEADHQRAIKRIKLELDRLRSNLTSVQNTHLLAKPLMVKPRTHLSGAAMIVLGLVLGSLLGIMGAFMAEFLGLVRARIQR